MTIVMERLHWIDAATYFRSSNGSTHFCRVAEMDDGRWEIVFTRGATSPGPHYAGNFLQAKRWIYRYAARREKELMGSPARWSSPNPLVPSFGEPFDDRRLPVDVRPGRNGATAVPPQRFGRR